MAEYMHVYKRKPKTKLRMLITKDVAGYSTASVLYKNNLK